MAHLRAEDRLGAARDEAEEVGAGAEGEGGQGAGHWAGLRQQHGAEQGGVHGGEHAAADEGAEQTDADSFKGMPGKMEKYFSPKPGK